MSSEHSGSEPSPHQLATPAEKTEFQPLSQALDMSNRVAVLGSAIKDAHTQAQVHLAASLIAAIVTGEKLLEVKALLPRGQFLKWIDSELTSACNLSRRSAQRYMQLSNQRQDLVAGIRRVYSTDPGNELTIEEAESVLTTLRMKEAHSLLPAKKKVRPTASKKRKSPTQTSVSTPFSDGSRLLEDAERNHTPVKVLAAAKTFLGPIDSDRHRSAENGINASAAGYYKQLDNWRRDADHRQDRVFLHLPFEEPFRDWLAMAIEEYATESFQEALLLLPDQSGADWLRLLESYPRLHLRSTEGSSKQPNPSLIVGLFEPDRLAAFHEAFSKLGSLFVPYLYIQED